MIRFILLLTFISFSLISYSQSNETVTDIDGNVYKTVKIGNDTWMAENLAVTRYNDGTPILNIKNADGWIVNLEPAYRWYNNDSIKFKLLGALYNWYAIETQKLCPKGWHVATDKDWSQLVWLAGGDKIAGTKLRTTGTKLWSNSAYQGEDIFGFGALPAGFLHDFTGNSSAKGEYASFWTADQYSRAFGWGRSIHISSPEVRRFNDGKKGGFSVRCVKNKNLPSF